MLQKRSWNLIWCQITAKNRVPQALWQTPKSSGFGAQAVAKSLDHQLEQCWYATNELGHQVGPVGCRHPNGVVARSLQGHRGKIDSLFVYFFKSLVSAVCLLAWN